ncbi:MAG: hypothetical protein WCR97_03850 [Bacilli bacterium]
MESLEQIKSNISEQLLKSGYTLYSFNFKKQTHDSTLEIVIDREEPISLDDISIVSEIISKYLDSHEFTNTSYVLDVSSLGVEKPIDVKNIDKYIGKYINIHLTVPFKGESYLEGTFDSADKDSIILIYFIKGRKIKANILKTSIDKGRLAIKF